MTNTSPKKKITLEDVAVSVSKLHTTVETVTNSLEELAIITQQGFLEIHKELYGIHGEIGSLHGEIGSLRSEMNQRFSIVDQRLENIELRLDQKANTIDLHILTRRVEKIETKLKLL